jgi:hypothetical protein
MLTVEAEYRVVDRQNRTARIPEYDIDALVGEHLYDDVGAAEVRPGKRMLA